MNKIFYNNNWYVLKIITNLQYKIKKKIKKILSKYKIKIYNILNLETKKIKYIKGKKYIKKQNILPGYLLIYLKLNFLLLEKIKSIKGVIFFLNERLNKLPISLSYKEIKIFIKNNKKLLKIKNKIKIGNKIKIINGAFKGIQGKIIKKLNKKVLLKINLMGRNLIVKVNNNMIKK